MIFKGEDDWGENLSIKFAELVKECPLVAVTQSYTGKSALVGVPQSYTDKSALVAVTQSYTGKSGLVEVTQSYTGKSHHWLQ